MNQTSPQIPEQPQIVRYIDPSNGDVQVHYFSRCAIGYIFHGEKSIYYGDRCYKFYPGEIFFLGMGSHYIRNSAEQGHPFEQILFYYSTGELQQILLHLNMAYKLNVTNDHESCTQCRTLNHAAMPASEMLRLFFKSTYDSLNVSAFYNDSILKNIKMTELIYLLVKQEDCCLRNKLLCNIDSSRDSFQQTIHSNIFTNISIEELAARCNRSLTSFKKEFCNIYGLSPHQWFIRQRLIHARLLLISTDKPISEIGTLCAFSNTSHFIKLFRKQYDMTPANYRARHQASERHHATHPTREVETAAL